MDSWSSINVIFQEGFDQMDLKDYKLHSVETILFGFADHTVYPNDKIMLSLTFCKVDLKKTVMTKFKVVGAFPQYNTILRIPAMNSFMVVTSAYHQKIKFLVMRKVEKVRGDQSFSWKYYAEIVRVENKKVRREKDDKRPGR